MEDLLPTARARSAAGYPCSAAPRILADGVRHSFGRCSFHVLGLVDGFKGKRVEGYSSSSSSRSSCGSRGGGGAGVGGDGGGRRSRQRAFWLGVTWLGLTWPGLDWVESYFVLFCLLCFLSGLVWFGLVWCGLFCFVLVWYWFGVLFVFTWLSLLGLT